MTSPPQRTAALTGAPVLLHVPTGASPEGAQNPVGDIPAAHHTASSEQGPTQHPADEARFRALFSANYEALLRFAERRAHPLVVEDLVAEVLLTTWRRLDDVPTAPEEARAWVFAVAQRTLANQRRGEARRRSLHVRVGHHSAAEHTSVDTSAEVAARLDLARAWILLRPADQEVLTLTVLDGLTASQAAHVLGVSTTAVGVRLFRARRRLKAHLASRSSSRTTAPTRGESR